MELEAILTHALFAATGAACHWGIQSLRHALSDKAFRDLYHLPRPPESTVRIICPTQPHTFADGIASTYEDSVAQGLVQPALLRRGVEARLVLHHSVSRDAMTEDMFLVCGPVGNSVTKSLFEANPLPFCFASVDGSWRIVDSSGDLAHPMIDGPKRDYGIAAALSNPWSRDGNRIWLAAGIRGLGTMAAARVMTERLDLLRRQSAARNLSASFAALVEATPREAGLPEVSVLRLVHL